MNPLKHYTLLSTGVPTIRRSEVGQSELMSVEKMSPSHLCRE